MIAREEDLEMIIVKSKPPIWDIAQKHLGFKDDDKMIFTYDNIIYNPNGADIDIALYKHEEVHRLQQKEMGGAAKWWAKYFLDHAWRAEQEADAYGRQYCYFCNLRHDRNLRFRYLRAISKMLGSMYGFNMDPMEAKQAILNKYEKWSRQASKEKNSS